MAPAPASATAVLMSLLCLLSPISIDAQNAKLDPSEARALNSLFQKWKAPAPRGMWNLSGEPCTGAAVNGTGWEDPPNNPSIQCDCNYANRTVCHITRMRVYALDKTGILSEELAGFQFLQFFKIDQNFFTGQLPAFIGNLTSLQLLSVAQNAFFGPIPRELGNLKELTLLSFGINNFSGTLPPEIGNLVKLEQLYINSCGAGGEIPTTFANLQNLLIVWASDCPFTGVIPDFIGSWTRLNSLRLQGNSFQGPIPSSFANLTSLTALQISDLHNVSSSLDFIKNLTNLDELVLRNALLTGSIPPDIGKFQKLRTLDLSFNNLTGRISSDLFNLSVLTSLFLGNNSFFGTLPSQKSRNLQIVDLSYNELEGSFPSWVAPDLRVNLVGNNFQFDNSNRSILQGLECLQRNFPCHRNEPRYANFSIKCGGDEMRSADGILYEAENSTSLGAASFYVIDTEKWAVSNVGVFADRANASYLANSLAQISNTDTPELFQTSRLSSSSLRYYGLGLQNGVYNISLLFAEIVFEDRGRRTWKGLGRRVFDIYIQGVRQLKDFDISKEAGRVERAVTKDFQASVMQNYLEIHLFWAGKGTCCTPHQGDYGPQISAIHVVSDFTPTVSGIPPTQSKKRSRTGLIAGIAAPIGFVGVMLLILALYMKRKRSDTNDEEDILGLGPRPDTYGYAELRGATEDFSPSNKLGEGGFGPVFKGTLNDGRVVAVKQLSIASHQGKSQFMAEIATISAVQHRNLVKLYGCCIEGNQRLLVYEYLENKSLDQTLFGKSNLFLDWPTRFGICLGIARGLAYLHEESRPRIVHRDVKSSNILLDAELRPKISDFGLAKLYDDKMTHISTRIAGTIGYLAPEYAMRGHLTEKADVFSFGVVSLEILCGRSNSDDSLDREKMYLLEWVWNLYETERSLELVDPTLNEFDECEVMRMVGVALLCTQASPSLRPPMSRVIAMLSGDVEVNPVKVKPSYLTDWDFKDTTSFLDNETPSDASKSAGRHELGRPDRIPVTDSTTNPTPSPINLTEPMLHEHIKEGR